MNREDLLNDKTFQFWSLQLTGWTGWGVMFFVGTMFWGKSEQYHLYLPIVTLIGLLLSLPLRSVYRKVWDRPVWQLGLVVLVASYITAMLWWFSRSVIFYHVMSPEKAPEIVNFSDIHYYFDGITTAYFVMLCWSGLYFGIKFARLLQVERERGLKVAAMAHEAQLKMLRYQLNPHFLFNTLNAISTLVLDKDTELANAMVTRLSHFLRYSLDNDPMQKVSLSEEIEALELYLDIEKVRFAERLKLKIDLDGESHRALIPSLLLQPLVENSIKYAIADSIDGGTISIAARVFAGDLLIEISDDGPGIDFEGKPPRANGVGLANTRERLLELYGNSQSFRLGNTDPRGLTIHIRLPFEAASGKL
ncbi:MAG: two-component system LytT family sensor kinase [Halieaceae bacterium]|jgi:two-component system LytT family sensor kinase